MKNLDNINVVMNIDFDTQPLSQDEYKQACNTLKRNYISCSADMEGVCKKYEQLEYKLISAENKASISKKTLDKARYMIKMALKGKLTFMERITARISPTRFGITNIDEMQKDNI